MNKKAFYKAHRRLLILSITVGCAFFLGNFLLAILDSKYLESIPFAISTVLSVLLYISLETKLGGDSTNAKQEEKGSI